MSKTLPGDRNILLHTYPTVLIVHLKRLIMGKIIQNHIPFDTTLDLEPYISQGHPPTQKMKLIGIISHQGTKDNGHYTAITKKEDTWTLYNDAITTQTTTEHIHQTQAYILMYRKTELITGMGKSALKDIPKKLENQPRAKGIPNPILESQQRRDTPAPQPESPIKTPPGQSLPQQGRRHGGANPVYGEGSPTENQRGLDTPSNTHDHIPLTLEAEEKEDGAGTIKGGRENTPSNRMGDERERPSLQEEKSDQLLEEPINLFQSISVFFHLSQGRIEELTSLLSEIASTPITMEMTCKLLDLDPQMKEIPSNSRTKNLIDGLTEDPEDNPDGFIPIMKLHNARLKKAHDLHEATSDMIQQKWVEGTDLEDLGKFLQSWAPEPYGNKPMPKGMTLALLGIAPNSQVWAPIDLSNCIFRNTEAADSIDDLVRALKSMGTTEGPTSQDPKITPAVGLDLVRVFPRMRSLHEIRRDWLSDEELWLAIPEGEKHRHCLTHVPRHSCDDTRPRTCWFLNLRISGSITINKVDKAVSWNVGPHGYKGSKEEIHKIFEQGPPIICLQDVRIPKRRKILSKENSNGCFPTTGFT